MKLTGLNKSKIKQTVTILIVYLVIILLIDQRLSILLLIELPIRTSNLAADPRLDVRIKPLLMSSDFLKSMSSFSGISLSV